MFPRHLRTNVMDVSYVFRVTERCIKLLILPIRLKETHSWKYYIPPKLLLCGLGHEPPILDGDGDIVFNLKSTSAFERFPCFRWFSWRPIQINCCHVSYSRWHLIATLLPPPIFALGTNLEIVT
jgi:hypothetical protein